MLFSLAFRTEASDVQQTHAMRNCGIASGSLGRHHVASSKLRAVGSARALAILPISAAEDRQAALPEGIPDLNMCFDRLVPGIVSDPRRSEPNPVLH